MANSTVDMVPGGLESDEKSSPLETSVIVNSVLNALLIPICITGNVLVLAAVWRNPSLRSLPSPLYRFLVTILSHVCHKQGSSSIFNSAVFPLKQ